MYYLIPNTIKYNEKKICNINSSGNDSKNINISIDSTNTLPNTLATRSAVHTVSRSVSSLSAASLSIQAVSISRSYTQSISEIHGSISRSSSTPNNNVNNNNDNSKKNNNSSRKGK